VNRVTGQSLVAKKQQTRKPDRLQRIVEIKE
jgi:hypothetical protein